MLAVDTILPSDTSALYEAVANGDRVKLVHSYAKAVRHAFSAVSNRKSISDVSAAEEKVDEFYAPYSGSLHSNSSRTCRPASYSQSQSFSLGSYYWQSLLQNPWSSSTVIDFHLHAYEIDSIIDECASRSNAKKRQPTAGCCDDKKPPATIVSSDVKKDLRSKKLQHPLQQSPRLRTTHMHEEDVKYLGKVLSNSRPPPNFTYSQAPRRTSDAAAGTPQNEEDGIDCTLILFDGSHGPTNGSLIHLACVVDSPLILATLLSFGGDPSIRHTAFRRLPIHEAACHGSTGCLTLLLEISQLLVEENSHRADATLPTTSFYSGWSTMTNLVPTDADSKPSSQLSCGLPQGSSAKPPEAKLVLADPSHFARISFLSALKLILELNTKVDDGLLLELEAARALLRELGIPQGVRTAFTSAIPLSTAIDGHGNTALHWASFKNQSSCVSLLLESGAPSNFRSNHFGWTPLHDAAYSDSADVVTLLLEAGADIDARSNSGATPLCFAAQEDSPNAAEILLQAGADAAVKCNGQQLNQQGNVVVVNSNRINHAPSRFSGYTPLHYCSHYNAANTARVLIKHGAPMEMEDFSGRRPIHVAVARGSSDVLRELLHAGTRVETIDIGGSYAAAAATASSAPSRLESPLILMNAHSQALGFFGDNGEMHPQGRIMAGAHPLPVPETIARQIMVPGQQSHLPTEVTPVSSPVLIAMIPPRPVHSSKPWNCLTQQAIDECKYLLNAAEGHWSPRTHRVFSPTDRRAILELLKVGKRFEQMNKGIFLELWPHVLSFCGRGWFEPDLSIYVASFQTGTTRHDMEEDCILPARPHGGSLSAHNNESLVEDISVDGVHRDEDEDMDFTQFHLESDDRRGNE